MLNFKADLGERSVKVNAFAQLHSHLNAFENTGRQVLASGQGEQVFAVLLGRAVASPADAGGADSENGGIRVEFTQDGKLIGQGNLKIQD